MNWRDIQKKFKYEIKCEGEDREIESTRMTRTGLEFSGFFTHKKSSAIVLWGKEEFEYLSSFSLQVKSDKVEAIFKVKPPLIITSRSFKVEDWLIKLAKKHKITILSTSLASSEINTVINLYLAEALAKYSSFHANLLEIYGKGVLIFGQSGIGKSEISMELVKKGHMFVADDAVECANVFQKIIGRPNELSRGFMEIRGVGIVNIIRLFGIEKVKPQTEVSVIIEMVDYNATEMTFERLGREVTYKDILGVKIPYYLIPVTPGRKISDLIEVIIANLKLIDSGYNSFKEFEEKSKQI